MIICLIIAIIYLIVGIAIAELLQEHHFGVFPPLIYMSVVFFWIIFALNYFINGEQDGR